MVLVDCLWEVGLGYLDQCVCVCFLSVSGKDVVEYVIPYRSLHQETALPSAAQSIFRLGLAVGLLG